MPTTNITSITNIQRWGLLYYDVFRAKQRKRRAIRHHSMGHQHLPNNTEAVTNGHVFLVDS